MSEKLEPAFKFQTVRKVVGWGFGLHGWRVCDVCKIKQQVSLDQVTEWLLNKSTPRCGRCQSATDLVRQDAPQVTNYLIVKSAVDRVREFSP